MIGLWSSSATWMFLLLASCKAEDKGRPLPCDFLSKNLYTIEANPLWYSSCFWSLEILNALSLSNLSAAVLFAKSLKSS